MPKQSWRNIRKEDWLDSDLIPKLFEILEILKNSSAIKSEWGTLRSELFRSLWNPDKEHGFDANQSVPGNMLWEELYAASPKGQKVI